jgi:hypothetical protein
MKNEEEEMEQKEEGVKVMEGKMEEYSDEKVERFSFLKPWV